MLKRKIIIVVSMCVAVLGVVAYVTRNADTLVGRLDTKVAFFRGAPEKEKVIENAFVSFKDGAALLINSAIESKRITLDQANELKKYYSSTAKMSRAEFAAMIVHIFQLQKINVHGPYLIDVAFDNRYAQEIQTCILHGCMELEFKPNNQATWDFAQKAITNLQRSLNP